MKPSSPGHRIRFIRSLFRYAYEETYLTSNPSLKLYACQLLDNGASLDFIQGMLGHEKASTTQIYAHSAASAGENFIDAFLMFNSGGFPFLIRRC
ncbi:tyrosine-type recombinase/integrase [Paenibacillus rhizosphaerae]|uniref:tyrosine-type recombinase/integrase n=1 Tax=Paenibacillus rhizosphaerae TaxID=297318 RepID=UPI001FE68226|nr:tyrosine-type recombinase/integrase [Paenibacillus rhizosphaerae]